MRVLVCGDRNWTDYGLILRRLRELHPDDVVIEGEARGADTMGRIAAEACGLDVEAYPANWQKYGPAAGPIRNQQMLREGKPDLVLAFHNDLANSKGTKHMVEIARKAGVAVEVHSEPPK